MNVKDILAASAMPVINPSYPHGPFRFINREYLIVNYETDPDVIREALPEELEPVGNTVFYEWMKMPDSSGFGDYEESGMGIPCTYKGEPASFSVQMYLNDEPPITGGREIWGFPKKYGEPRLRLIRDTLTGTLSYDEELIAMGTMSYKYKTEDPKVTADALGKLQINLKLIPDVDGKPKIAQLVGYHLQDITVKGAWTGPARLHLVPHVNARVADFPVRRIIGGRHLLVDFTLPYGKVYHDYLA